MQTNEQTDTSKEEEKVMHKTLPQSINSLSTDVIQADQSTNLSQRSFMGLFRREGAKNIDKKKPRAKVNKGRFNCQDIRKFYSYKMQQPGKVSINESARINPPRDSWRS